MLKWNVYTNVRFKKENLRLQNMPLSCAIFLSSLASFR